MTRFTWTLSAEWILTTDRPESSYGQPVLVNVGTQQAFGWADYVPGETCTAGELSLHLADGHDNETLMAVKAFSRGKRVQVGFMWG